MDTTLDRSISDSDIHISGTQSAITPPNFISMRNKRKREEDISQEFNNFKEEVRKMISTLMSNQESEFKKNATTLKEILRTNTNIENSVAFLSAHNEEYRKKIESLEGQIKEDKKYITILEDKIEEVQRDTRKTNFEMKNVPKKNNETKEDLMDMILSLSNNIDCKINKSDIRDIYRIRSKKEGVQNTPIIVETSSTILKTEILKMSKSYNIKHKSKLCAKHLGFRTCEDTPIFISEQLTSKAARLYFLARDLVKSKAYKFCWTAYGKVYLRKDEGSHIILITNEPQIHKLLQEK
ncbi:jg252 [Pararge aegeria aegeria]|uniref:Jg252 protein n=1 Tax=Pararge aegeria aegeria TaxID=348720 RepID=A0A8S4QLE3_9NEOP|nr:jg252 [Pararge aegeria aegeria]